MPLHCCLKITGCLDTWCGLERQRKIFSGTQDSQTYLFFWGTVCWELYTLLKDKGWFLESLLWSRTSHKRGYSMWWQYHSGTFQKDRNRGTTKAPMFPFRPLYTISFIFLNICSTFQSPKWKLYMKLCFFRACSIMPSGLSAVSMCITPSLLYLSNTEFIYSFPGKYGHCICNWFYCCSAAFLCRANLVPINARHLVSRSIKRVWETC